jgi:dienelactone hydrolase
MKTFYLCVVVLFLVTACSVHIYLSPTSLQFPKPDGAYTVGHTNLILTDASRDETFTPEVTDKRELPLQLWYPSSSKPVSQPDAWMGPALEQAFSRATGIPIEVLATIKVNAYQNLPVATGKHPVVILSHGMLSSPLMNTSVAERLASHGYVVIGVTHPYSAMAAILSNGREALHLDIADAQIPDQPSTSPAEQIQGLAAKSERILEVWQQDIAFVIQSLAHLNAQDVRFAGHLDLNHMGIMGHSFGGATALRSLHLQPELKAAINLDGSLFGTPEQFQTTKPVLLVNEEGKAKTIDTLPPDLEEVRPLLEMVSTGNWIVHQNATASSAYVSVVGAKHNNFTDFNLLVKLFPELQEQMGSISGDKAQDLTSDLTLAFFEQHLEGKPARLLQVAEQHSEIRLELR